jgi:hypothetical protein
MNKVRIIVHYIEIELCMKIWTIFDSMTSNKDWLLIHNFLNIINFKN